MEKRIMVVDDEEEIAELLKKNLIKEGYEVVAFYNGESALRAAQDRSVDLLISDLRMPGMSGEELFFKMKKMDPFLQVIIATAYPSLESIAGILETGAAEFIIKPFTFDSMTKIVHEVFEKIERWRALRQDLLKRK